jgi:hypothetical protein
LMMRSGLIEHVAQVGPRGGERDAKAAGCAHNP